MAGNIHRCILAAWLAGSDFIGWAHVYKLGRRTKDNYYARIYAREGERKTEETWMYIVSSSLRPVSAGAEFTTAASLSDYPRPCCHLPLLSSTDQTQETSWKNCLCLKAQ